MTCKVRALHPETHQHNRVEAHRLDGNEKFHRGYEQGARMASRWWLVSGICVGVSATEGVRWALTFF